MTGFGRLPPTGSLRRQSRGPALSLLCGTIRPNVSFESKGALSLTCFTSYAEQNNGIEAVGCAGENTWRRLIDRFATLRFRAAGPLNEDEPSQSRFCIQVIRLLNLTLRVGRGKKERRSAGSLLTNAIAAFYRLAGV